MGTEGAWMLERGAEGSVFLAAVSFAALGANKFGEFFTKDEEVVFGIFATLGVGGFIVCGLGMIFRQLFTSPRN